ncbi:hypothetical protein P691DRAFT_687943, partial [Macrolepiota fuliginosa MF-IS2]
FWEHEIPVDSDDATQDMEWYLHTEFIKIREDNPNAFPSTVSTWPSDGDFLKVSKALSRFFVFASTLMKYISINCLPSCLKVIVSLIDQCILDSMRISQRPFSFLDMLYTQIMSDIQEDLLPIAKSLLGYFRLVSDKSIHGMGLVLACNILGLCQDEAYDTLHKLHSILTCPSPVEAKHKGTNFFHASFSDFLFDCSRSKNHHADLDQKLTNTWWYCIRILQESC